jgi:hypothetical protein
MPIKTEMLTADEIEALLKERREASDLARAAFGGGPLTPEELEQRQRGDEWWEKRLRQMREAERKRSL